MMEKIKKGIKNPKSATRYVLRRAFRGSMLTATSRLNVGKNLFKYDWDLLIILDSCRVDALREVANNGNYAFLNTSEIRSIKSVGTTTGEWTALTFTTDHLEDIKHTAFISANSYPYKILEDERDLTEIYNVPWAPTNYNTVQSGTLGKHITAWQHGDRSMSERNQSGSELVADYTIKIGREEDYDRVISQIIEPHYPYVSAAKERGGSDLNETEVRPFPYLKSGGDLQPVWKNYITELRSGLDTVARILENFDAGKVLITADHGEAFGEWGQYGHASGSINPVRRRVPTVETIATDKASYEPSIPSLDDPTTVEENLKHLGYLD